ncbi:MAG: hypothetical protein JHC95_18885 [Solirubrobacteraceae bacterium]|nr:hypothetical protein [Solirubrobacteraceae bacterium]
MRARLLIGWVLLGLAGVALAVGVTMAATSVTSQRIGLDSEPLSAGSDLVPSPVETTTRTVTVTVQTTAAPPTTVEDSGEGHGRGRDHAEDD